MKEESGLTEETTGVNPVVWSRLNRPAAAVCLVRAANAEGWAADVTATKCTRSPRVLIVETN
jgi:hypothetical protein